MSKKNSPQPLDLGREAFALEKRAWNKRRELGNALGAVDRPTRRTSNEKVGQALDLSSNSSYGGAGSCYEERSTRAEKQQWRELACMKTEALGVNICRRSRQRLRQRLRSSSWFGQVRRQGRRDIASAQEVSAAWQRDAAA